MRQKGFATIFGLCLILVVAIIVKGINDAETNHAREVINFETEQILQRAAESAIVEAAAKVRGRLVDLTDSNEIPVTSPNDDITVEAWGKQGQIHFYNVKKNKIAEPQAGVYIMSRATIDDSFFGETIYRRAYAYILVGDTTIYFMELPTLNK